MECDANDLFSACHSGGVPWVDRANASSLIRTWTETGLLRPRGLLGVFTGRHRLDRQAHVVWFVTDTHVIVARSRMAGLRHDWTDFPLDRSCLRRTGATVVAASPVGAVFTIDLRDWSAPTGGRRIPGTERAAALEALLIDAHDRLHTPPEMQPVQEELHRTEGWYPDPADRFDLRYWDGERWTVLASTEGEAFLDPVPV